MTPVSLTLSRAWRNGRQCWRDLALTDIAYKVLAFIVLTPLTGLLLHILIALSGRTVVADEDIIQFLLEPLGWLCIVSVGAIWIAILALEQTALLGVLGAAEANQHMRVTQAITFAASHAWSVLRVTLRMVALALLAAAPFLTIAGITYLSLLTKFDINFYLQQKPREFQIAIGIGVLLGIGLAVVLLRLATSWFFALPLVVFEGVAPSDALRVSRERARGHRPRTVFWIVAWLLVTFLLSALATGTVTLIAKGLVPQFLHRLPLLLFIVGATVVAWATVNLIVNLISATTFAVIFFRLYADHGSPEGVNTSRLDAVEATMRKSRFSLTRTRLAIVATVALIVSAAVGAYAIRTVRPTDDARNYRTSRCLGSGTRKHDGLHRTGSGRKD